MYETTLPDPILVGRKSELKELKRFLDLSLEGKGTTVFISGEAGSGKTRLITEFLEKAKEKDVTILVGWCLDDAAVPYFPFVEAFDSYTAISEDKRVSMKPILSPLVPRWTSVSVKEIIMKCLFVSG